MQQDDMAQNENKRIVPLSENRFRAFLQSVDEGIVEAGAILYDLGSRTFGGEGIDEKPEWLQRASGTTHLSKGTDEIYNDVFKNAKEGGSSNPIAAIRATAASGVFFALTALNLTPIATPTRALSPNAIAKLRMTSNKNEVINILKSGDLVAPKDDIAKAQFDTAVEKITVSGDYNEIVRTIQDIRIGKDITIKNRVGMNDEELAPIANRFKWLARDNEELFTKSVSIEKWVGEKVDGFTDGFLIGHNQLRKWSKYGFDRGIVKTQYGWADAYETETGRPASLIANMEKRYTRLRQSEKNIGKIGILREDDVQAYIQAKATRPKAISLRKRKVSEWLRSAKISTGAKKSRERSYKKYMKDSGIDRRIDDLAERIDIVDSHKSGTVPVVAKFNMSEDEHALFQAAMDDVFPRMSRGGRMSKHRWSDVNDSPLKIENDPDLFEMARKVVNKSLEKRGAEQIPAGVTPIGEKYDMVQMAANYINQATKLTNESLSAANTTLKGEYRKLGRKRNVNLRAVERLETSVHSLDENIRRDKKIRNKIRDSKISQEKIDKNIERIHKEVAERIDRRTGVILFDTGSVNLDGTLKKTDETNKALEQLAFETDLRLESAAKLAKKNEVRKLSTEEINKYKAEDKNLTKLIRSAEKEEESLRKQLGYGGATEEMLTPEARESLRIASQMPEKSRKLEKLGDDLLGMRARIENLKYQRESVRGLVKEESDVLSVFRSRNLDARIEQRTQELAKRTKELAEAKEERLRLAIANGDNQQQRRYVQEKMKQTQGVRDATRDRKLEYEIGIGMGKRDDLSNGIDAYLSGKKLEGSPRASGLTKQQLKNDVFDIVGKTDRKLSKDIKDRRFGNIELRIAIANAVKRRMVSAMEDSITPEELSRFTENFATGRKDSTAGQDAIRILADVVAKRRTIAGKEVDDADDMLSRLTNEDDTYTTQFTVSQADDMIKHVEDAMTDLADDTPEILVKKQQTRREFSKMMDDWSVISRALEKEMVSGNHRYSQAASEDIARMYGGLYAPAMRQFDERGNRYGGAAIGSGELKAVQGSKRPVLDTFDSSMSLLQAFSRFNQRQQTLRKISDDVIEWNKQDASSKKFFEVLAPSKISDKDKQNAWRVWNEGEESFLVVRDRQLRRTFEWMDRYHEDNGLQQFLQIVEDVLKMPLTSKNPMAHAVFVFRDGFETLVTGSRLAQYGVSGVDVVKEMVRTSKFVMSKEVGKHTNSLFLQGIKRDTDLERKWKLFEEHVYIGFGGRFGDPEKFALQPDRFAKVRVASKRNKLLSQADAVTGVSGSFSDNLSRFAAFSKLLDEGVDVTEAAARAIDVVPNYGIYGRYTSWVSQVFKIPFLRPAVGGTRIALSAAFTKQGALAMSSLIGAGFMNEMRNQSLYPGYHNNFPNETDFAKMRFIYPTDDPLNPKVIEQRIGWTMSVFPQIGAMLAREQLGVSGKSQAETFRDVAVSLGNTLNPVSFVTSASAQGTLGQVTRATLATSLLTDYFSKETRFGNKIITESMEDMLRKDQYRDSTPQLLIDASRFISRLTGDNALVPRPAMTKHILDTVFGSVDERANDLFSIAGYATGHTTSSELQETLGLKKIDSRGLTYSLNGKIEIAKKRLLEPVEMTQAWKDTVGGLVRGTLANSQHIKDLANIHEMRTLNQTGDEFRLFSLPESIVEMVSYVDIENVSDDQLVHTVKELQKAQTRVKAINTRLAIELYNRQGVSDALRSKFDIVLSEYAEDKDIQEAYEQRYRGKAQSDFRYIEQRLRSTPDTDEIPRSVEERVQRLTDMRTYSPQAARRQAIKLIKGGWVQKMIDDDSFDKETVDKILEAVEV